jgi:tRNA(Ile)-lysidine synthase
MLELKQDFIEFARRRRLIAQGDRILVACSGGSDSVALLRLLDSTKSLFGIELSCGHIDHGIRPGSHIDAEFVKALCMRMSIPLALERISETPRGNLEDWARNRRRSILERMAREFGATKIALAHNANDKAETLIHNLARGSGLYGLGSMRSMQGSIVRPLLFAGKNAILGYLGQLGQEFVTDESNFDLRFSRNLIRASVIPELESVFPETVANLSRFSELASDESDYLDSQARQAIDMVLKGDSIDCGRFSTIPEVLKPRMVRLLVDNDPPPSLSACLNVVEFIETAETGKSLSVCGKSFNKVTKKIVNIFSLHETDQRL